MSRSTWMSHSACWLLRWRCSPSRRRRLRRPLGISTRPSRTTGASPRSTSPDTFVARAVAVQPDGRIIVAGYSCDTGTCGPTGDSSFRLVRYTADGGLDTDFGDGGMVTTAIGAGPLAGLRRAPAPRRPHRRRRRGEHGRARPGLVRARGLPAQRAPRPGVRLGRPRADARRARASTRSPTSWRAGATAWSRSGRRQADGRDRFALARFDRRGAPDPTFDSRRRR